jgi:hypothetical protein
MLGVFRTFLLLSALLLGGAVAADDTFTVLPQQAVSLGTGGGDSFMLEGVSPAHNSVTVLLRPKGETCTFRFSVDVGQSVNLRIDSPLGQAYLCEATLRPIIDTGSAQFRAECTEKPVNYERKCPPVSGTTASATH